MKTKFLPFCLLLVILATIRSQGQTPAILWDKTIGGTNYNSARAITTSNDGGFVIAGYSNSGISGSKTENVKGFDDYWIVKLNNSGQKVWDKTIGGSNYDRPFAIVATTDGGFVVAGYSNSGISGDKTENTKGFYDFWVVKLNSSGQKVWDKTIGGNNYDNPFAMVATTDGGFIIAGNSNSGISGDKTEAVRGFYDYWVVKLNSSGQKVWDKTIGGSNYDYAYAITASIDGGFVVAGYSNSGISGDKTEDVKGFDDYWIVKLNSSGQIVWDKTIGGSNYDNVYAITASVDGGFVIAGYSNSGISGDKTENVKGFYDYWIVKLDSSGQKVWDKTIGGSNNDYPFAVAPSNDGGFIIAGYSDSGISGDKTENTKGFNDYWIVKLNSSGQKVWDKTIGGNNYDYAWAMTATSDGGFAIVGDSNAGVSGDKSEANIGFYDYWVVRLSDTCPTILTPTGTANQTVCYNTTASLSATCQSGTIPNWYNSSSTAIPFTGTSYTTPNLTVNTTYKVRCENGATPNCAGLFTDVVITVNPIVNAPTANGTTINQYTSTTLSAVCTGSTAKWYSASSGGTTIGTGSYTTPILSANTTYYVACETGGTLNCVSSSRTAQTVTIIPATSFDSAITGNWNDATTWTCNCIPNGTLPVRIVGTHVVTVPTAYTGQAKGLQMLSTGKVILQGTAKVNVSN